MNDKINTLPAGYTDLTWNFVEEGMTNCEQEIWTPWFKICTKKAHTAITQPQPPSG